MNWTQAKAKAEKLVAKRDRVLFSYAEWRTVEGEARAVVGCYEVINLDGKTRKVDLGAGADWEEAFAAAEAK